VKRPTTTKGFPEMGKRLTEYDITLWRHVVSSTALPPSSQRSDSHRTPTGDPPYKRCGVVRTYMLHLHYSKETVTYSPGLYLEC